MNTPDEKNKNMKTTQRVSLAFTKLQDDVLITFATTVHSELYAMSEYSAPPVSPSDLMAAITAFSGAKVAQASGGKVATAEKNLRREELLTLLKKLAYYVQVACENDLVLLLSSGFEAVSTNQTRTVLPKPSLVRIVSGMSGQALVTATADRNARGYEVIVAEIDENGTAGPFRPAVTRTSSRNIPIADLTPGKLYAYQGRAIGGATDFSDWSDVVVQRAA